jgi:hypothetical protein
MRTTRLALAIVTFALSGLAWHANAIEGPKQTPEAPPPPAEPPKVQLTPTDEREFFARLQRVTHRHNLAGFGVPEEAAQALGRGDADAAIAALGSLAASGDVNANIALIRIQHWCGNATSSNPPDVKAQIAKIAPALNLDRAARAAGVFIAQAEYAGKARAGCSRAQFDYNGIEGRLRAAAAAGNAVSATELSQFTRDPAKRATLLQAAVDKNFGPAQYALATQRLMAVQRGETTENVASIRLLLKQSIRSVSKARVDLANCMALGCDGHPADAATAKVFGEDAARDGEPTAFLSMARMPWGAYMGRVRILTWQYFGDRLNEAGCMGENYVLNSLTFFQTIGALEKNLGPTSIADAKQQADKLWADNAPRAMKEQGCSGIDAPT